MPASLHRLAAAWHGLSSAARWRIVLGVVVLGVLLWLLTAVKPWEVDVGPRPKVRHLVKIYTWWGAAFGAVVFSGLALLAPWWAKPLRIEPRKSSGETPRWFWPLVVAAMAITACLAYPRLDFGLWDDEELCARDSIVGRFRTAEKSSEVQFQRLKWEDTFYGYETPNNHVLHSIFSRLSSSVAKPAELPFSERALRLPAYLFGILSIAALAWFLKEAGFPAAGTVAAFLLAIHPWHIRYASEARGYSFILLLVPLLFVFWQKAVAQGTWKWWSLYAGAQVALLYTYPGMLFLLIILNGLTLPALGWAGGAAGPFSRQSGRWFFVNSCAAVLIVILMLPLAPQARVYFDYEAGRNIQLGWDWVRSALSYLLAGVPWAGGSEFISLANLRQAHPWALPLAVSSVIILLTAGAVVFGRRSPLHACIAAVIFATPVLTFLASRLRKMLIYESYLICVLPGLVGLAAVGVLWVAGFFRKLPAGRFTPPVAAAALILLYAAMTHDFRRWLTAHPLQQIRESVQHCRPTLAPDDSRQIGILTGSFCIPPYLYDAHMVRLDSATEFIALLEKADQTGKPLYINIGMPWAARDFSPRMWQMFSDDRLFGERREFLGFDAGLNRQVAKYKPGSAINYDFSALRGTER